MRTLKSFLFISLLACAALTGCRSKPKPEWKPLRTVLVGPWISEDGSQLVIKMTGNYTLTTGDGTVYQGKVERGSDMLNFSIRNDPFDCGNLGGIYHFDVDETSGTEELTLTVEDDTCSDRRKLFGKTWLRP